MEKGTRNKIIIGIVIFVIIVIGLTFWVISNKKADLILSIMKFNGKNGSRIELSFLKEQSFSDLKTMLQNLQNGDTMITNPTAEEAVGLNQH